MRSVISDAQVAGNDQIKIDSAACGRRNSLQEGFFEGQIDSVSFLHICERELCEAFGGRRILVRRPPFLCWTEKSAFKTEGAVCEEIE